ncbi:hypothetical protein POMI540_2344 [Schizosaccharomyces pombe]
MLRPLWPLFLTALFLNIYRAASVLIDEAGKNDFEISLLGKVNDLVYDTKNEYLYAVSQKGLLAKLNASNGDVIWRQSIAPETSQLNYNPVTNFIITVDKDYLYIWNSKNGILDRKIELADGKGKLFEVNKGFVYLNPHTRKFIELDLQASFSISIERDLQLDAISFLTYAEKNYVLFKRDGQFVLQALDHNYAVYGPETVLNVPENAQLLVTEKDVIIYSSNGVIYGIHVSMADISQLLIDEYKTFEWSSIPGKRHGYSITVDSQSTPVTYLFVIIDSEFVLIDEYIHEDTEALGYIHMEDNQTFSRVFAVANQIKFAPATVITIPNQLSRPVFRLFTFAEGEISAIVILDDGTFFSFSNTELVWKREEALAYAINPSILPTTLLTSYQKSIQDEENSSVSFLNRWYRHFNQLIDFLKHPHGFTSSSVLDDAFTTKIIIPTSTGSIFCLSSDPKQVHRILWRYDFNINPESVESWLLDISDEDPKFAFVHQWNDAFSFYILNASDGSVISQKSRDFKADEFYYVDNISKNLPNQIFAVKDYKVLPLTGDNSIFEKISQEANSIFVYTSETKVEGFSISADLTMDVQWSYNLAEGEIVIASIRRNPHEIVASFGRVLQNREVMYKYLNPNLFALFSKCKNDLVVYVMDSVTGSIVYQNKHQGIILFDKVYGVFSENWLVYSYQSDVPNLSTKIISVELFEGSHSNEKIDSNEIYSRHNDYRPYAFTKAYIFDREITALGVTNTPQGITSRDVLLGLSSNQVAMIPQALLSPMRPVLRPNEKANDASFIPYEPIIPLNDDMVLSYNKRVYGVSQITSGITNFESTTLVLSTGLDVFFTRTAPSMPYDMLSSHFDKKQLMLTTFGILLAVLLTKPLVKKKQLNTKWYN